MINWGLPTENCQFSLAFHCIKHPDYVKRY